MTTWDALVEYGGTGVTAWEKLTRVSGAGEMNAFLILKSISAKGENHSCYVMITNLKRRYQGGARRVGGMVR